MWRTSVSTYCKACLLVTDSFILCIWDYLYFTSFWGILLLDTGFSFNSFAFSFLFVALFFASQCFLTSIIYKQKYAVNHIFSYQCMMNCFSLGAFIQLSLSFEILTLWLDMEVFVFILLGVLWDSCICRLNLSNLWSL